MARVYPVSPSSACTCTRTPVIFAIAERWLRVAKGREMKTKRDTLFLFFFFIFDGFLVRESFVQLLSHYREYSKEGKIEVI